MKKSGMLNIKTGLKAGEVTVYGSPNCPWCVKQKEYLESKGVEYKFVDCTTQKCPDFVQGYPTTVSVGFVKF